MYRRPERIRTDEKRTKDRVGVGRAADDILGSIKNNYFDLNGENESCLVIRKCITVKCGLLSQFASAPSTLTTSAPISSETHSQSAAPAIQVQKLKSIKAEYGSSGKHEPLIVLASENR
jgi:hypothetical protein